MFVNIEVRYSAIFREMEKELNCPKIYLVSIGLILNFHVRKSVGEVVSHSYSVIDYGWALSLCAVWAGESGFSVSSSARLRILRYIIVGVITYSIVNGKKEEIYLK